MNRRSRIPTFARVALAAILLLLASRSVGAQVGPEEIRNPRLSAIEARYLPQLRSLQLAIGETQFRLPFILTRYVGMDPSRQASLDTRGLEFVHFQNRTLLKTSGFYTAAYNSEELTSNERASRTFQEVVIPILHLIGRQIPADVESDDIGFEIAYHTRAAHKNSDFEGREILAVVFNRTDAFAFVDAVGNDAWQEILNRSQIYLNAKPFGLNLGQKEALDSEALKPTSVRDAASSKSLVTPVPGSSRVSFITSHLGLNPPSNVSSAGTSGKMPAAFVNEAAPAESRAATVPDRIEKLQEQYQPIIDAFLKDGPELGLVEYAPPTFAVVHRQVVLQFTLRNPLPFEGNASSIYRRAARSFDLFLAPRLKALVPKFPADLPVDALSFSILNHVTNEKDSSEAVEFICPMKTIRSFVEDEMTSQEVIDQSLVLVNDVRISLNLGLVE